MKYKLILLLTFSLLFINACCSLNRIGNLISPKTNEQMKKLYYQEIISPHLTDDICFLNYPTNNFYYPTKLDYVKEFENDNDITFSVLISTTQNGGFFITVTGIKYNDQYNLVMTFSRENKIEEKAILNLTEKEFSVLLDSVNNIASEIENIFGTKTYIDTIALKNCTSIQISNTVYNIEDLKLLEPDCLEEQILFLVIGKNPDYIAFVPWSANLSDDLKQRYRYCYDGLWNLFDNIKWNWLIK